MMHKAKLIQAILDDAYEEGRLEERPYAEYLGMLQVWRMIEDEAMTAPAGPVREALIILRNKIKAKTDTVRKRYGNE